MEASTWFQIGSVLIVPALWFVFKKINTKLDSISDDMIKVKTVLMGPEGENGLRSDVRALQTTVGEISSRLDRAQVPQ